MKHKYRLLLFTVFIGTSAFAQPVIKTQRAAGGSGDDRLTCIDLTKDGGLIAGGYSYSNISGEKTEGNRCGCNVPDYTYDYWIVKYDSSRNIEWDKTIGGNSDDELYCLRQTSDGGYILGGYSWSGISGEKTGSRRGVYDDYWIVKLGSKGKIEWDKTIGGSETDVLSSLQQTSDGGYILGGASTSGISGEKTGNNRGYEDYWIVKLDSKGNIQWDKTIGGSETDVLSSLQQTSDGGYILGGWSYSNISGEKTAKRRGGLDYWIVKLNSKGNIQWDKTIGGSDYDDLTSLQQTTDGGYILGGYSNSNVSGEKTENRRGLYDYWIVKLDDNGNIRWDKTIGGQSFDALRSLQQTSDDGYILGGTSASGISGEKTERNRGSVDYWLVKLNSKGNIQWDKTIGGSGSDECFSVKQTSKKRYVAAGYSDSNDDGDKERKLRGSNGSDFWLVGVFYDPGSKDLTQTTKDITSPDTLNVAVKSFSLYPNPVKDILHIQTTGYATCSLTDASGKTVLTQIITGKGDINTSRLKAGVYFVKNHATGEVRKVMVE